MVPPLGYGVATLKWTLTGKPDPMVCTFGYDAGALADTAARAVAINVAAQGVNSICDDDEMLVGYTFIGVDVTETLGGGSFQASANAAVAGTLSGDPLPPNCSILVTKTTARGGREGKGRMFLPPAFYGESGFDANGNFIGAGLTRIGTALNTFRSDLITASVPMVLLHTDPLLSPDPVTSLLVSSRLATQRRRLR